MEYKTVTVENLDGTNTEHIIIERAPGEFTSLPAVDGNPAYEAFKEALKDA